MNHPANALTIGEALNNTPNILGDKRFIAKISSKNGIQLDSNDTTMHRLNTPYVLKACQTLDIPKGTIHSVAIIIPFATVLLPPLATLVP